MSFEKRAQRARARLIGPGVGRRIPRVLRHALGLVLALALCGSPALANAKLYRWVDALGVTHYTTDPDEIPREFRDSEQVIPTAQPRAPSSIPRGPRVLAPKPKEAAATAAPAATRPQTQPATEPASAPAIPPAEPSAPALAAPPLVAPPTEPTPATPTTPTPSTTPVAPAAEPSATETAPTVFPGPPATGALPPEDPRSAEVASLEAQIATDRESLRQIISTKRWDSSELASDPQIREIAERLPRLQAQLAALRAEPVP